MKFTSKILAGVDRFISQEQSIIHENVEVYDNSIGLEVKIVQQVKNEIRSRDVPGVIDEIPIAPLFTGIKHDVITLKTSEFGNYCQYIGIWSYGTSLLVIHLVTAQDELLQRIIQNKLAGELTQRQIFIIIELKAWIKIVEHAIRQALETYQIGKKAEKESSRISILDFKPGLLGNLAIR